MALIGRILLEEIYIWMTAQNTSRQSGPNVLIGKNYSILLKQAVQNIVWVVIFSDRVLIISKAISNMKIEILLEFRPIFSPPDTMRPILTKAEHFLLN